MMKNNLRSLALVAVAAAAILVNDNVRQPQAQGSFSDQRNYSTSVSGGTANAQIVALPNYGRQVGVTVWFTPGNSNTGATTININSTGASSVKRASNLGLQDLVGGELVASGGPVSVMWTGSAYVLTSRQPDRIGETVAFRSSTIPSGYLVEDGSCVSQTTYAALFAAIGSTYGSCSAGAFKLPDSRGSMLAGLDNQGSQGAASRLTSAGSGCTATSLTGTGCGAQNNALTSVTQFPPYTPGGSVTPFNITGHLSAGAVVSGTLTVGFTAGQIGTKVVSGSTYSVAGGVGIGTGDALAITGFSDTRIFDFTSDTKTVTWTGNAVGASAPFTTLPPVSLLRFAIKT